MVVCFEPNIRRRLRPDLDAARRGRSAARTQRGIDEQVAKAEKAVAGQVPVRRNRFNQPSVFDPQGVVDLLLDRKAEAAWMVDVGSNRNQ